MPLRSFLISKLLSNPTGNLRPTILMALLESPAPVAVGHHGISFLRTALLELGRPGVEMYVDTLCSVRREGQSPQIVEVAGAVVGPCVYPPLLSARARLCRD